MIRVIIADDESPAREQVREFLETEEDVSVVAECASGDGVLEQLRALQADLLLLDIRMPGLSGLEVLKAAAPRYLPYTIFITAFGDYAVEAFAAEALDYLVKPLERARFRKAIDRARRFLQRDTAFAHYPSPAVLEELLGRLRDTTSHGGRIGVKVGRATQMIALDEVVHIEAAGDYVTYHLRNGRQLRTRESITILQGRLPSALFARIHRSLIVNVRLIRELRPDRRGGYTVTMDNGARLHCSPTFESVVRLLQLL